jgi:hypothetical protein
MDSPLPPYCSQSGNIAVAAGDGFENGAGFLWMIDSDADEKLYDAVAIMLLQPFFTLFKNLIIP